MIQDKEVIHSLVGAAQRLGGHVYVLTTLKTDDFSAAAGRSYDQEGDFQEHIACIEKLSAAGILVKARSDCHAKFLTIDDRVAILTSANAVPTCYGNVRGVPGRLRSANPENGVRISMMPEVRRLANFFRSIWRCGCNYFVKPGSGVFSVEDLPLASPTLPVCEPDRPDAQGEVLWTAPGDLRLERRIREMIDSAEKRLDLSTWVIKGMAGHPIGNALEAAAGRGVHIRLLARGMNTRDDLRDQCYRLAKRCGADLVILGDFWNHSKAVVTDDRQAMVLTANLDAQHGLESGIEVGFCSSQPAFVSAVSRFLDRVFDEAAFIFVVDPSQETMAEHYGRQKGRRIQGTLHFTVDGNAWPNKEQRIRSWCEELQQQLVRVAWDRAAGQEQVLLLTEKTAAYCSPQADGSYILLDLEGNPPKEVHSKFSSYLGPSDITIEWK